MDGGGLEGVGEGAGDGFARAEVDVVHRAAVGAGRGEVPAGGHSLRRGVAGARQDRATVVGHGSIGQAEVLVETRRSAGQGEIEAGRVTTRVGHLVYDDVGSFGVGEGAGDDLARTYVDVVQGTAVGAGGAGEVPTAEYGLCNGVAGAWQNGAAIMRCGGVGQAEPLVEDRRSTDEGEVEAGRVTARVGHFVYDDVASFGIGEGASDGLTPADVDVVHRTAVATGGAGQVPASRHRLRRVVAGSGQDWAAIVRTAVAQGEALVQDGAVLQPYVINQQAGVYVPISLIRNQKHQVVGARVADDHPEGLEGAPATCEIATLCLTRSPACHLVPDGVHGHHVRVG